MRSLILSLALLAAPSFAQEVKPVGAVIIMACHNAYGVVLLMSDGSYMSVTADQLAANPAMADYIKAMKPSTADIVDPAICGQET